MKTSYDICINGEECVVIKHLPFNKNFSCFIATKKEIQSFVENEIELQDNLKTETEIKINTLFNADKPTDQDQDDDFFKRKLEKIIQERLNQVRFDNMKTLLGCKVGVRV